jgi:agmatine deiminase
MSRRMPAEWELHDATWIAWPHEKTDWPTKLETIDWVYAEIVKALSGAELVQIICFDEQQKRRAEYCLKMHGVTDSAYKIHLLPTDRSWLRDSAPTAVINDGKVEWIAWTFNAWAKYDNYLRDQKVPELLAKVTKHSLIPAIRPDNGKPMVLEGGAIEADGEGTLIVTEECLLSEIQERNPGLTRDGYEKAFAEYLGITKTIWLSESCDGDDTHGHIDDAARFYAPGKVLLAFESDPSDPNFHRSKKNLEILESSVDAKGRKIEVTKLPMPKRRSFGEDTLPASYANFYIANSVVIVPTFNDENDYEAIGIIRNAFPTRKVIGIAAVDLVLGFGTLHCLSQQQPRIAG